MSVPDPSAVGITFTETMTGFISTKVLDDYAKAEAQGRRDGSRCEFTDELRPAEERHNQFVNQFIAICERLLEDCERLGQLHPGINAHQASRAVHGLLIGLIGDWLRDPHRPHARPIPTARRARSMLSFAALSAPVPPMLRVCTGVQMFPSLAFDDLRHGP